AARPGAQSAMRGLTRYFRAAVARKYSVCPRIARQGQSERLCFVQSTSPQSGDKSKNSARMLDSPLWWLRSDAVRIGLSGQYGDRRNISAQMRRENVSSVPALQRGLTPKRRHQDLP